MYPLCYDTSLESHYGLWWFRRKLLSSLFVSGISWSPQCHQDSLPMAREALGKVPVSIFRLLLNHFHIHGEICETHINCILSWNINACEDFQSLAWWQDIGEYFFPEVVKIRWQIRKVSGNLRGCIETI